MKLHVITIGRPRLTYAQQGWEEYWQRLRHYYDIRATHIPDKHNDSHHILEAAGRAYKVVLAINGKEFSSPELALFLETHTQISKELVFIIGGPDGLPSEVMERADYCWSFGRLTFPHDLAMVMLLEALYRGSAILNGLPYHK